MADSKVSELTSATSIGVSDYFYVVQNGSSKKATAATVFANAANVTLKGNINLDSSVQLITTGGTAVDLTKPVTHLAAGSSDSSITIPAGTTNQIKYITMISTTGGAYIISQNIANNHTIRFTEVGDSVQLLYTNNKWCIVGGNALTF